MFTGKAQEVSSALSSGDCKDYKVLKSAVIKGYELVPEALGVGERLLIWC